MIKNFFTRKGSIKIFFSKILVSFLSFILLFYLFHADKIQASSYDYYVKWYNPFTTAPKFSSGFRIIEKPHVSTYFEPKIRIQHELCILFACGRETYVLDGFGECGVYWGTGFVRACARAAGPCQKGPDEDPSIHVPCRHDNKGNNNPKKTMLCAYNDPAAPLDLNDNKLNRMPFHENTPAPGVGGKEGQALLIGAAFAALIVTPGLGVLMAVAGGIAKLVEFFTSKINWHVISDMGCVEIPLAPFPPPYCPTLPISAPTPTKIDICQKEYLNNGSTFYKISNLEYPCELGSIPQNKYSSFEKHISRVTFTNPLPLCSIKDKSYYDHYKLTQEDPEGKYTSSAGYVDPWCVILNNITIDNPDMINDLHTRKLDLVEECRANDTEPCVEFPSRVSYPGRKFRILYESTNRDIAELVSAASVENSFTSWVNSPKKIWGINSEEFVDISMEFPQGNLDNEANPSSTTLTTKSFNIIDPLGLNRTLYSRFDQAQNQVCIFDNDHSPTEPITCENRAPMAKPIVSQCNQRTCKYIGGTNKCLNQGCASTFINPSIAVGLGKDNWQQTSMTYRNGTEETFLHGYKFGIKLTDQYYTLPDQNGDIVGKYLDQNGRTLTLSEQDKLAILNQLANKQGRGTISLNGKEIFYDGGLEFYHGRYKRGAEKICLEGYITKSQVLAKKINDTISLNTRDRIIPPFVNGQTEISGEYNSPVYNIRDTNEQEGDLINYSGRPGGASKAIITNIEGQRLKTSLEEGLCVDAPYPECLAENWGSQSNGFARWPSAKINQVAHGTCVHPKAKERPYRTCRIDNNDWSRGRYQETHDPCRYYPNGWWPSTSTYREQPGCSNCRLGMSAEDWENIWFNHSVNFLNHFANNTNSCIDLGGGRIVCRDGRNFCHKVPGSDVLLPYAFYNGQSTGLCRNP